MTNVTMFDEDNFWNCSILLQRVNIQHWI